MMQYYPESGSVQYEITCSCGYSERTKPAHESGAKLRMKLTAREHLLGRTGHEVRIARYDSDNERGGSDD